MRAVVAALLLSLAAPASAQTASPADAQALYDANVLSILHVGPLTMRHGHPESWWVDAARGKDRQVIRFDDFYTTVGRPDLAQRWSRRHRALVGIAIAGGVLLAGGLATAIAGGVTLSGDAYSAALATGAIGGALGLAGLLVGTVMQPPVNPQEAEAMASDYNRKLHRQLGLDGNAPSTTVSPTVSPHGGGLVLSLRF